jgi:hypothetical protein
MKISRDRSHENPSEVSDGRFGHAFSTAVDEKIDGGTLPVGDYSSIGRMLFGKRSHVRVSNVNISASEV